MKIIEMSCMMSCAGVDSAYSAIALCRILATAMSQFMTTTLYPAHTFLLTRPKNNMMGAMHMSPLAPLKA